MGGRLPIKKGTICSGLGGGDPRRDYASKGRKKIEQLEAEERVYENKEENQ